MGRPKHNLPPAVEATIRLLRAEGWSFQAIADDLTAAGIPTLTGRQQWYPIQVKRVLEDREDPR